MSARDQRAARGPLLIHFAGVAADAPEWISCELCTLHYADNAGAVIHAAASVGIERSLTTNEAVNAYMGERHAAH